MDTTNAWEIKRFISAFLDCAEWSSYHTTVEDGKETQVELDSMGLGWSDAAKKIATKVCKEFIKNNKVLLTHYCIESSQAGHDLWLTAQGHGAGFWDRGHPKEIGDALSAASKTANVPEMAFPQDGELHFQE